MSNKIANLSYRLPAVATIAGIKKEAREIVRSKLAAEYPLYSPS
jgi:hypothetical protein